MKILVVEDDPGVAMLIQHALEEAGYNLIGLADTGERALALAAQTVPDMALLDIDLKGSMRGTELAAALFTRWRVPCLFLSSNADEVLDYQNVAVGLLGKPYKASDAILSIEAVRSLLDGDTPAYLPRGLYLFMHTIKACRHTG